MGQSKPIEIAGHSYDPETIDMLRGVLDEIWDELSEPQRNQFPRSQIAEWLLQAAASGEREPVALRIYVLEEAGRSVTPQQPNVRLS